MFLNMGFNPMSFSPPGNERELNTRICPSSACHSHNGLERGASGDSQAGARYVSYLGHSMYSRYSLSVIPARCVQWLRVESVPVVRRGA